MQSPGMATNFSMLGIMNAALISQGFEEILSENDGTNEQRLLSRNWPALVEAELEDGLYHFTKKQVQITTRQEGLFGYADAYLVPQAALHVRRVWTEDDSGVRDFPDWVQDGNAVHVNSPDGVWIEYLEVADPSMWGANFTRGVQMKLEAVLLRFKEEVGAAERMEAQAETYFQRARTNSSRSRSAQEPYKASRFARARFRRG